MTSKETFLQAFERLFDQALKRLRAECTPEEREDAKREFIQRFAPMLHVIDKHLAASDFPEEVLREMEQAVAQIPPAELARIIASIPLVEQMQAALRFIASKVAEQRLLEYALSQADSKYGGN